MAFVEHKIRASILERETATLGNDGCPKTAVVTVNKGAPVPFGICYCKIYSVRVVVGRGAVVHDPASLRRVKEFGSFGQVGGRDEFLGWYLGDVGVCDPPVRVAKGYAENINTGMKVPVNTLVIQWE